MILYKFIKYLILHIKYKKMLQKIYQNENLLTNLSYLFQSRFKQDWIGRVYTVLNPLIIGDEVQINTQILEYGPDGLSNKSWIDKWVMDKLTIAQQFIRTNNLFELLTYDIKQLDEYNYLFVMQPIVNLDLKKYTKRFIITYSLIIILLIILLIIFL